MPLCATRSDERGVVAAATVASGLAFLAGSAVNIALPTVQRAFGVPFGLVQWVVGAQTLALASLILVAGSLGDAYGKRRLFLSGIAVFGIGAFLAGISPSIGLVIAAQAISGVGAAMMVPMSLALINSCVAAGRRGTAIGLWGGLSAGVAALGPFAGGVVVQAFGWSAVFFAIVPVAAAAYALAHRYVPHDDGTAGERPDLAGAAAIAVALGAAAYALITGPSAGWSSSPIVAAWVVSAAALSVFLVVERRARRPAVPFSLFYDRTVAGANLVTLFLYFGLNGVTFFTVFYLQRALGYSATATGLALLPAVGLIALFSGPAGALTDRIGARTQMVVAPLVVAGGFLWLSAAGPGASYVRDILPGMVLFGLGMAAIIAPLTRSALSVPERRSGVASGVNNTVARAAGLMAVAALGAVVAVSFTARLRTGLRGTVVSVPDRAAIVADAGRLTETRIPAALPAPARREAQRVVRTSFVGAYDEAMRLCALLAAVSSVIAFATIGGRRRDADRGATGAA